MSPLFRCLSFNALFLLTSLYAVAQETASIAEESGVKTSSAAEESSKKVIAKKGKSEVKAYVSPYYNFDDDKDGVPNGRDKCPNTPGGEKVTPFGCPHDTDFDGIFDYEDKCVTERGPKENYGCPWGDKDSDGVKDNIDKCPTEPGELRNAGCPRKKVDTDGDGLYDDDDLCPATFGIIANKGCPEIKAEEKAALKKAFDNLLFETGKDVIMSSSFTSLDELAKVLSKNPQARLHIEGHTDNVGDDNANLNLSQNRSIAVKNYLIEKGISEFRITTDGFGETKPVATNDTNKGRSLNRRVEMNIKYE